LITPRHLHLTNRIVASHTGRLSLDLNFTTVQILNITGCLKCLIKGFVCVRGETRLFGQNLCGWVS